MSSGALQVLGYLKARSGRRWSCRATDDELAKVLARSVGAVRAAVAECSALGMVEVRRTGRANQYTLQRPKTGFRYVKLPDFADGRLWKLPPAAFRVLVAICSYADKTLHRCFPRLSTIARKLGLGRRAVQIGVRCLRDAGAVRRYLTGRASVYEVAWPRDDERGTPGGPAERFAPLIDKSLRLALRTIAPNTSTRPLVRYPHLESFVSAIRTCLQRREAHWPGREATHTAQSLIDQGLTASAAMALASGYTQDQVYAAIELAVVRVPHDARAAYIEKALAKGWV